MDHGISTGKRSEREFLPFTDSLASRIRWRACDYAALISAELDLILRLDSGYAGGASEPRAGRRSPGAPMLASEIRLLNAACAGLAPRRAGRRRPDTRRGPATVPRI